MTILSDFFVASRADAVRYAASMAGESGEEFALAGVVSHRGVTGAALGALWATLDGVAYDPERHGCTELARSGDDEIWLEELPDALVRRLAELDDAGAARGAQAWGRADVLADLRALARDANARGLRVFVWCSM